MQAKITSPNMSELELLVARAVVLSSKVDFWNNAVLVVLLIIALAGAAIFVAQRKAFLRAKDLAVVQDKISNLKEAESRTEQRRLGTELATAVAKAREADARIAEAQRGSAEANERALKAQQSLASAEQHAKEADAKAEGFRADIAKANEGAALAQAQVADATAEAAKANLELARIKLPRSLNQEQQRRIADVLTRFTGTNFAFLAFGDPESLALLGDIDSALQQAHWNRVASPPNFGSDIGFNTARGMVSQINDVGLKVYFPADVPAMESIVRGIAAAISSEGVPCEPHFSDRMRGYTPRMILISVGQKRL
jgi:hypothetical protein